MMASPEERTAIPYLHKLVREHRALNRRIDTTKTVGAREDIKVLKRRRLRLKDKIAALQHRYHGRGLTS